MGCLREGDSDFAFAARCNSDADCHAIANQNPITNAYSTDVHSDANAHSADIHSDANTYADRDKMDSANRDRLAHADLNADAHLSWLAGDSNLHGIAVSDSGWRNEHTQLERGAKCQPSDDKSRHRCRIHLGTKDRESEGDHDLHLDRDRLRRHPDQSNHSLGRAARQRLGTRARLSARSLLY